MSIANWVAEQVDVSRDWTKKLLADVTGEEWTFQPAPGIQHVLWLCGHLAVSEHLLVVTRALGGEPPDAKFAEHFAIGKPVSAAGDHSYPLAHAVIAQMDATHAKALAAIRGASDAKLAEPCFGKDGVIHPHYKTVYGAIAHCARHESFHAGQIAMLRRLQGKAFLR
ncbi:MAG: DinB family protein [Phycisphaerales bacterium]|nr:DinB family protein [Phycisphaerales bacterium]